MHPDVTKLTRKFNRWHHHVDYRPFKKNKVVRKEDSDFSDVVNDFGMKLKEV